MPVDGRAAEPADRDAGCVAGRHAIPPRTTLPAPPTRDIGAPDFYHGTWGQGLLSEWWETAVDLLWPQSNITYGRMRHDPQIKAVLAALTWPLLRATWVVDPFGCRDEVVQRVSNNFGLPIRGDDEKEASARTSPGVVWTRHLRAAMQKFVFGHMPFERRYALAADGLYDLVSLGPRMPWTLAFIKSGRDGTVEYIQQTTQNEPIPGPRLVWYVHELEGSQWAGISALRPAFGAWLIKHETWRVHATSIRRFGMGVPQVTAPPGATAAQVSEAQSLASGLRVGDQTGVGLPQGFQFSLQGLVGQVPDALGFIKYLDQQISKMALAGIVDLGQTEIGSRALGETFLDLFLLALQGLADEIGDETTTGYPGMPGAVADLVAVNWGEDEPVPRILATDVGQQHEVTAQSLMQLLNWGAITTDPKLEAFIRQAWRLPQRETPQPPAQPTGHPADIPLPSGVTDSVPGQLALPAPAPAVPVAARAPRPGAGQRARAAYASTLRRGLTPAEVRAGFDPVGHQIDWQAALDWVLSRWPQVFAAQRDEITGQVQAAVDSGKLDKLSGLKADSGPGRDILRDAMLNLAVKAREAMIGEAAHQGVTIDADKVKSPDARLGKVAAARAALAAAYVAQQASNKALQMAAGVATGADVADSVDAFLGTLSDQSLRLQVAAALTAAQNAARISVLDAAAAAGNPAVLVATEVLDANTCAPCQDIDGTEFGSMTEAEAAYPNGGYSDCLGMERCRGTCMGLWSS